MAQSTSDIQQKNIDSYSGEAVLDRYSIYRLYPGEKVLVGKYWKPGDYVLDHACGAGRTTLRLHEMGFRVKGIDTSDTLIEAAKARFPYIAFEKGSYCEINEPDAAFDHVMISFNSLDYAYPQDRRVDALSECHRILKPGGTLIFSSHNIKSLHASPVYFQPGNFGLKLKNTATAFRDHAYLAEGETHTFFASPDYVIQQTEKVGFHYLEMVGVRRLSNPLLNRVLSPYIYYAFRKLE